MGLIFWRGADAGGMILPSAAARMACTSCKRNLLRTSESYGICHQHYAGKGKRQKAADIFKQENVQGLRVTKSRTMVMIMCHLSSTSSATLVL
eukprot:1136593-Pelagomonas_calceolata.AAC.3